jgi:hypothetical protein
MARENHHNELLGPGVPKQSIGRISYGYGLRDCGLWPQKIILMNPHVPSNLLLGSSVAVA